MQKGVLWLFGVVLLALIVLSLRPDTRPEVPESTVFLRDASVVLYPRADSEAVWHFASPEVDYSPDRGTSVLHNLSDGRRVVDGETDFTLQADELLIDQDDNLRGDLLYAHLLRTDECLTMLADGASQVLIDQSQGLFEVPLLRIEGPAWGDDNEWQRVRATFDLEEFSAGGPGTVTVNEFLASDGQAESGRTACAS